MVAMQAQDWFSSPYFTEPVTQKDQEGSLHLIPEILAHHTIKGKRVIDTACRDGAICSALQQMGYDVTGVDQSLKRVEDLNNTHVDGPAFFQHDVRLPFWGNYFDCALNLRNNFGYYRTRREHDAAMRTIANSLVPGGLFIIDYLNVHYTESHPLPAEYLLIHGTNYEIHRWDDAEYFYKKIIVSHPSLNESLEFTYSYAKLTLGDFTDMLSFQGMQIQQVYGDYDLASYDTHNKPRLIIVARKKSNEEEDGEKRLYSDGRATDALT